jgi:hypothetical protein
MLTDVVAPPAVRVRDLRAFWRCSLAVLVAIPMAALAIEMAVVPLPVRGTVAEGIAGVAAHPGRAQAALWLALVFGMTVLPATMAAAWTARRRAPRLTLAAGVLLLLALTAVLPDSDLAEVVAADKGLNPSQVAAIDAAVWAHPAVGINTVLFLVGQAVGLLLLGIALWRARVVPAWAGILLAVSGPAHLLAPGGNTGSAIAWTMTAIGYVLTTVAMFLAVPGYIALFAGGAYSDVLAYVTATVPGIDSETAFQLGSGMEASAQAGALGWIFVAGHLLGTVLLGIALWRSRLAPAWLAIGLAVSQPIHLTSVLTGIRWLDLVGWGLTGVGFSWAAWRLLRMRDAEFDLPPVKA